MDITTKQIDMTIKLGRQWLVVSETQTLKIETSPDGVEALSFSPAAGEIWDAHIEVKLVKRT